MTHSLPAVRIGRLASGRPFVAREDDRSLRLLPFADHAELLRSDRDSLHAAVSAVLDQRPDAPIDAGVVPFVDGATEVWAAGVTYLSSRMAREAESSDPSVYSRVYDHERPELFFKAPAWRVVTEGQPIAVRGDSALDVPEPELALVLSSGGEILGYSVCNDVSSRSIEGENPLYLPQAKVYDGSCALAATWVPAWQVRDPYDLAITIAITRAGSTVWADSTHTGLLHRDLAGLASVLFHALAMPGGAVLATGTCLAPDLSVTLMAGDVVTITIESVGVLHNVVEEIAAAAVPPSLRISP